MRLPSQPLRLVELELPKLRGFLTFETNNLIALHIIACPALLKAIGIRKARANADNINS